MNSYWGCGQVFHLKPVLKYTVSAVYVIVARP